MAPTATRKPDAAMTPAPSDSLLTNLRLPDGGPAGRRIAITDGRIVAIMPAGSPDPDARQVLDLGGGLLLPGLVDGHMHLDKTLFGLPWQPHAAEPFRQSRIDTDQPVLPALPLDAAIRAGADLVGGIDLCEMDHNPSGQIDGKRAGAEMDVGAAQPDQFGGPKARLGIEVEQCRVASSGPGRPIRRGQQGIDFRLGQIGHEPSLEALRRNG